MRITTHQIAVTLGLLVVVSEVRPNISAALRNARANGLSIAQATKSDRTPSRPIFCMELYAPVCGRLGSRLRTYSNQCFAHAAGAKVVAQGPCRTDTRSPAQN
jgi:hypothetical protein